MMCAGLTTYSPLVRAGVGPGKQVAIVGMWVASSQGARAILLTAT